MLGGSRGESIPALSLTSAAFFGCGRVPPMSAPAVTLPSLLCAPKSPSYKDSVIACGAHQTTNVISPPQDLLNDTLKSLLPPFVLYM